MDNLQKFLRTARSKLHLLHEKGGTIVLGNESCDLDSAVSAIIEGFHLHSLHNKNNSFPIIPVLNIKKKEYPLRTEVTYWLRKHDIEKDSLIFRDELDWHEVLSTDNVQLCLVDHNILPFHCNQLEPLVTSVIDHHTRERTNSPVNGIIVEPVGCCCTLIVEQILKKTPEILAKDICSLIHGTIVLDTVNLDEQAERTTEKDVFIIEKLENIAKINPNNRTKIFRELSSAKSDISGLSSLQVLQKDKKVIKESNLLVYFSSIPLLAQKFQERDNVGESLKEHLQLSGSDVVIVMGIDTSETIRRDLMVYSPVWKILEEVSNFLEEVQHGLLQLDELTCSLPNARLFAQRNIGASRKIVLPLLKHWLQTKK